jgi:hypothetical protein
MSVITSDGATVTVLSSMQTAWSTAVVEVEGIVKGPQLIEEVDHVNLGEACGTQLFCHTAVVPHHTCLTWLVVGAVLFRNIRAASLILPGQVSLLLDTGRGCLQPQQFARWTIISMHPSLPWLAADFANHAKLVDLIHSGQFPTMF